VIVQSPIDGYSSSRSLQQQQKLTAAADGYSNDNTMTPCVTRAGEFKCATESLNRYSKRTTSLLLSVKQSLVPVLSEMEATATATSALQHPVESKVRHIYLLARPIQAAGVFSILSHGKFPLCHWGVLLSELRDLEKDYYREYSGSYLSISNRSVDWASRVTPLKWGSLFELCRDPLTNQNKAHVVYNFGHTHLQDDWKSFCLRKIGVTTYHDGEIFAEGSSPPYLSGVHTNDPLAASITSTYPHYDGYSNNCQNFVLYLLDYLCPGASLPDSIQGLVNGLFSSFYLDPPSSFHLDPPSAPWPDVSRLPGSYPRSSDSSRTSTCPTVAPTSSTSTVQTYYSARSTYDKCLKILVDQ
jgi:hypothetical protein